MSKGGGDTTTVQQADPWSGQQPYLTFGFGEARNNYLNPPDYYPYATYVPFSSQTEQGLQMMQDRAINGSPVESAMQNYITGGLMGGQVPGTGMAGYYGNQAQNAGMSLNGTANFFKPGDWAQPRNTLNSIGDWQSFGGQSPINSWLSADNFAGNMPGQAQSLINSSTNPMNFGAANDLVNRTMGGEFLNSNPYLDQMFDAASRKVTENFNDTVMPNLDRSFAAAGGTGSQIRQELAMDASDELGQNLTDLAANIYGNNYANERSNMMNAINQSGDLYSRAGSLGLQGAGMLTNDDLARRGMNMDATGMALQDQLARSGMDMQSYLAGQNRALSGAQSLLSDNANRLGMAADMYNTGQANQINYGNLYNNLYGTQGDYMNRLASMAPTAASFDYNNINNLLGVGSQIEGQAQNVLGDQMNRYNYYQNLPDQQLANYISAIQGNYGGTSSTTESGGGSNPLAGGIGGAMSAAGLASAFPGTLGFLGGPLGLIGGGLLGALGVL